MRVLNFKTTWSEFQVHSQTKVRILNFKTICLEFKIPSQNAPTEAEARCIFRVSSPPQSRSKAVVCVSTPRMYPRSGYFLVIVKEILALGLALGYSLIIVPFKV